MKTSKNLPVLVGIGQLVKKNPEKAEEPVDYMLECARKAEEDSGAGNLLDKIDSLSIVNVISKDYGLSAPLIVAEKLNAKPYDMVTTSMGGTAPQALTSRLCDRISKGQSEMGLICGAEAFYSGKSGSDAPVKPIDANKTKKVLVYGDLRQPVTEIELQYGLVMPAVIYSLFANAYRKANGLSMEENLLGIGELCEKYAEVAVSNEYAWFRDGKSASNVFLPRTKMILRLCAR